MKIKSVLLIYPPTGLFMRDDRCQAPVEGLTAQPARAPLDLAYMAANLEKEGIRCKIKDYPAENKDWEDFRDDLGNFMPDMLVISITTPTIKADLQACRIAKEVNKNIVTVSKGAHYKVKDEEMLIAFSDLDIVIRGESELSVAEIVIKEELDNVLGITYRKNGKILKTPDRNFLEDLDHLPLPARHLLDNNLYLTPDTKEPLAIIYTGRGCPHQCIFCAVPLVSGNRIKMRSPENIVREIEDCVNKYKIRNFFFRADTFTWNEDWVVKICQLIINKGLRIRWGANSRVDTINENRLKWMKRAGCWIIGFGIESGNQMSLDLMKKKIKLEDVRKAVRLCKEHNIKVYTLFIIGFPWDNRQTVKETVKFAKQIKGDYLDINIAYPIPGTELFEIAENENLFNKEYLYGYDYSKPIIRTRHLSTPELVSIRRQGLLSFYLSPHYIFRTLSAVRSPKVFLNYVKSGLGLIPKLFCEKSNVDDFREEL